MSTKKIVFEPIGEFVVVKALDNDLELEGIILPEQEGQQHALAEVVAVGPGKHVEGSEHVRHKMQCKIGDTVLVNTFRCAPENLPHPGLEGKFMLIPEKDIAAIVREEDTNG